MWVWVSHLPRAGRSRLLHCYGGGGVGLAFSGVRLSTVARSTLQRSFASFASSSAMRAGELVCLECEGGNDCLSLNSVSKIILIQYESEVFDSYERDSGEDLRVSLDSNSHSQTTAPCRVFSYS